MALINCPECGKQVSDTAPKCPNCGFPIKSALNKVVPSMCPECGMKVDSMLSTCPNCGCLMKKNSAKERFKQIFQKENTRKKVLGIFSIIIVGLLIIIVILSRTRTSKFDFVEYIGKDYVDLPKNVITEEYVDNSYCAEQKSPIYLCGIKGTIDYYYSTDGLLSVPGLVDDIYWSRDDWNPTDKEIEKIRKKLNDIYGTYDYSTTFDASDKDYYEDNETETEYYWYNRNGIDITLSIRNRGSERSLIVNWEETENGIN